ncbi:dTDP-3-amino-3,4,6-trideoxy-alpha-D-glucose transaminase [subsurface metagenome]
MKIPLVDLKAQYDSIRNEIDDAIRSVIENTQFILGPEVATFESEMAAYCQTKFAIGVASGTDALQLALLSCGIRPGDEVITTPFTFIATTEAITQCGATPVLVDIDPKTYNIDPQKLRELLERRFSHQSPVTSHQSPLTAILPVHLYGQPADMDTILELGKKYNLKVIEDCAQALGAAYSSHQPPITNYQSPVTTHRKVGSLGDAGCLSFFPSKVLGAYGDGGMVVTNSREIAENAAMLRNHGCKQKYHHLVPGFNSRLDELQAAILRVKLRHLDDWIELRRQKASAYSQLFDQVDGVQPPYVAPDSHHIFNYYTIRLDSSNHQSPITRLSRDKLREHLNAKGIATAIYYPLSLHLQQVYKSLGYKPGDFPESEEAQQEVLSLPMYPEMSEEQVVKVVDGIKGFCTHVD